MADESHASNADRGALTNLLAQLAAAPEGDAAAWSRELKPGEALDRFEVIRELGRGGFGAVYEARDRELGRRVALKTLRPGRARDEWSDEQLQEEARAAAALSHPGIVTLFEACTCDRGPYLVMELLRGETLEERLARGPLPVAEAVEVGLQVARALAHVHEHGLVHRDIKPGNLFLGEDGRVKLLDLGLAHLLGSPSSTGGTPAYVAPEQWRGEQVDGRADVFALGAVLFELCTGRRAFEVKAGGTAAPGPGPAPALEVRGPRGLSRLVARCLDQDPAARPTAAEAAAGLLEVQRRLERPKARRRLAAFVAVGIAVGIGGALLASRTRVDPLAPGADGRIVVAVADFANETGDGELDGLSGFLAISLEQSRLVRVLTRSRLFDLAKQAGRENAQRIDEGLARDLGRRAGAQAVLLGTVRKLDAAYSVELSAIEPGQDELLFTERDQATDRGAIPGVIDRLAVRLRARLKEGDDSIQKSRRPVAEVTTANLAAWQHYVRGRQALDQGDPGGARREIEAAIGLDPGFALARYRLVFATVWKKGPRAPDPVHLLGPRTFASLLGQVDRLPRREELAVRAWRAGQEKRSVEALALRDEAASAFPDDKEAAYYAGEARYHQGDAAGAIPWYERALALDPKGYRPPMSHLVNAYWAVDRRDEALALARRCAEGSTRGDDFVLLADALLATGREADAAEAFQKAAELSPAEPAPSFKRYFHLMDTGRALEAERDLRRWLAELRSRPRGAGGGRDARTDEEEDVGRWLLHSLLAQGRIAESWRVVASARARGAQGGETATYPMSIAMATRSLADARRAIQSMERAGALKSPGAQFDAAFALAFAGDVAAAQPYAAAGLASLELSEAPRIIRQQYEAVVLQHTGKLDDAAAILRLAAQTPDVIGRQGSLRLLGEVELLRGDARAAAAALEAALAIGWSPAAFSSRGFDVPRSLLHAALAQERLGDGAKARERVERLMTGWWGNADADFAPAVEARALRARLGSARSANPGGGKAGKLD